MTAGGAGAVRRLALPAGLDDLVPLTIVQLTCVFVVLVIAEGTSTATVLQHRLGLSAATISDVVDRLVDGGAATSPQTGVPDTGAATGPQPA